MPSALWQQSLVQATEWALLAAPRRRPGTLLPPVIFCPSSGGQASQFLNGADATTGVRAQLVRRIADMGHVCLAGDHGGAHTFGNTTVVARLLTAWTYLQTHPLVLDGPAILVGCSMGNTSAVNFAREYGTDKVLGIISLFGLTDLQDFYANNRGGLAANVASAWGVANGAALPADANPLVNVAELGAIPWRGWAASDDALCPPATQTAFAAAATDGEVVDVGAVGHDDDVVTAGWDDILAAVSDLAA